LCSEDWFDSSTEADEETEEAAEVDAISEHNELGSLSTGVGVRRGEATGGMMVDDGEGRGLQMASFSFDSLSADGGRGARRFLLALLLAEESELGGLGAGALLVCLLREVR